MNTPGKKAPMRTIKRERLEAERAQKREQLIKFAPHIIIALSLIAGGTAAAVHGVRTGYNDTPRAGERDVFLSNQTADDKFECERELFSDICEGSLLKNKWRAENCDPETIAELTKSGDKGKTLNAIVEARRKLLASLGIEGNAIAWECQGGDMFTEWEPQRSPGRYGTFLDDAKRDGKVLSSRAAIQEAQRERRMPIANPPYRKGKRQTP